MRGECAVALINQPYFAAVNSVIGARGEEARGLLFSSWLVLIAIPFLAWRPRAMGLTLGTVREQWRLVAGTLVIAAAATAAVLRLTGHIPYSDASWFIEIVDVPVTEELAFRGVLLMLLLIALRRRHRERTAVLLAVGFDGLAFGIAHLANAPALDLGFVVSQATFAAVLGSACAWLAVKTESIFAAIALHAVVNAVVIAV